MRGRGGGGKSLQRGWTHEGAYMYACGGESGHMRGR